MRGGVMRSRAVVLFGVILGALSGVPSWARNGLPDQKEICEGAFVSKSKLSLWLLSQKQNSGALKRVYGDPVLWRTIFTASGSEFCNPSKLCGQNSNCDDVVSACLDDQSNAVTSAVYFFQ